MAMMLCPECSTEISDQAFTCPKCGLPLNRSIVKKKPIVGIVVAGILGVIDLWAAISSFTPGPLDIALFTIAPAIAQFLLICAIINSLGNTSLLIGVGLTALNHQNGPQVVRITCVLMLIITILIGMVMLSIVSGSLNEIDPQMRSSVLGGIIGGFIGGALGWCLVVYLFRKSNSW